MLEIDQCPTCGAINRFFTGPDCWADEPDPWHAGRAESGGSDRG